MQLMEQIKQGIFYLDGGTGTYLQACGLRPGELPELWNLTRPDDMIALQTAYYEAGCHAVCTNTFGANALKFDGAGEHPCVENIVTAAVNCAKKARAAAQGGQENRFIGLDVGPLGRLLQPLGDLSFERAIALFAQVIQAGAQAGVDFIFIETMNDCYETKAAVLAAKEHCSLPVFVSNVYDESGKTMSGTSPEAMVAMLEGLGVDALGLNCSLGPDAMLELLPRFAACASIPLLVKPNAGLPRSEHGKTVFDVDSDAFAQAMRQMVQGGARLIGGCCGTTPAYLQAVVAATQPLSAVPITQKRRSVVSSFTHALAFGNAPLLIGERINPTGKPHFKEALRSRDIGYVLREGLAQQDAGAQLLDVNVGLPGLDEAELLETCVQQLQSVCTLPLQLDTANPNALARAMRCYNGKPMVNSANGTEQSMSAVFPLAKQYGGLVVCLTLDEHGIPETAEGRFAIAQKMVRRAQDFGLQPHDLIFDPLAMTVSSDRSAARVTLDTIALLRSRMGALCCLGVSNVSFGLPARDALTAAFFAMALACGLNAAIMNPHSPAMQQVYHAALALLGHDENCMGYLHYAQSLPQEQAALPTASAECKKPAAPTHTPEGLQGAVLRGLREEAAQLAQQALEHLAPMAVIQEHIVPALDAVGRGYEAKTLFLPQLLMSAEAAKAALEQVKQRLPVGTGEGPAVVLATVQGDIHDIGKNIVKALLENYGYRVIDLGRDVAPEAVAAAVQQHAVQLVGLSALMTTTVEAMERTIALLAREAPACRVVVGGAVLTQSYAQKIGAHCYAKNAMETVRYAEQILGKAGG